MKFYNREFELERINWYLKSEFSEFIYLYWRRRIWKTTLIQKALKNKKYLYFYVWKKTKKEILSDFQFELEKKWYFIWGTFQTLRDLLEYIFKNKNLIIVFDEFQNFYEIDKWFFSDLQNYWDRYKDDNKIKLFFFMINDYINKKNIWRL